METEVYNQIKKSIKTLLQIDLEPYKDEQMRRRLDSWLVRSGTPSWPEYFVRVRQDQEERTRFRNYLTINVSSFFRDPERWETVRQTVLPNLLKHRQRLRVWSAGCSVGPEPYTLAIILEELTPGRRHFLLATDLDRGALERARARGPFNEEDLRSVSHSQRQRYFEAGGPPFFVDPSLAKRIDFREQNMLADSFESDIDLLVCRNVVIYFTEQAKATLYRKFHAALRPGGILFVGGTEIVPHAQDLGFRSAGISLYEKV